jgi:hypothetical protein
MRRGDDFPDLSATYAAGHVTEDSGRSKLPDFAFGGSRGSQADSTHAAGRRVPLHGVLQRGRRREYRRSNGAYRERGPVPAIVYENETCESLPFA